MRTITQPNLFMKLVLTALLSEETISNEKIPSLMMDYIWEVNEKEDSRHDYHVIGCHAVAKRIDIFLTKTVIQ